MTSENQKSANMPRLRFPEFAGGWEEKRLGEVSTFQRGFDLPSQDRKDGKIPIVSSGGITGFHNVAMVNGPGLVTGRYGSLGELFHIKEPHWPLNTALWVKDLHGNLIDFVFYLLRRVDFAKLSDKTGVPGINRNDLHHLHASIPSLPEQKKIAAFLGVVDAKIAALRAKVSGLETYKRGLMQALFSQTLRFTKLDGTAFPHWKQKQLGEVLLEHKAKSTGKEAVFSVSVHKGLVNQIEHLGRSFSAATTDHYNRVKPYDIVYTKSPTGNFPLGIIKQSNVKTDVIVSPLYGVFTPETPALGYVLHVYFESNINVSNYLSPIVQKGAKNTINVTNSGFLSNTLTLPVSHEEQQKIADTLSAMDAKIQAVAAQVSHMESFKKGLLQQMFV
jgi:type I restriction enzyme, S subunit